jgi:hypothetical protein
MAKLQNRFVKGIIDKDSDERMTANGTMIDAENFLVTTSEGSSQGVGKPTLGNIKISNFNIVGAKTIGKGVDSTKENVYNIICGDLDDYIIETNLNTQISVVVLKYFTGGVLNFDKNKRITNVDIIPDPEGNGNLIAWSGDDNPPRIVNIERAKTYSPNGFSEQEISVIKAPPLFPVTLTPMTSTENNQANYLEDRFLSFCYRYKYEDGYFSALSTWSEYFFIPGVFNIDFETFENLGMLNTYNAVNISFNTGPRDVVGIEIIFKLSNENKPRIVEKFNKEEEGWGNNQTQTIEFNNSKVYNVLPESEYFRSFDNVPLQSVAQTIIGNRICYGNYLENYDLKDEDGNDILIDYTLDLVTNNISQENLSVDTAAKLYTYGGVPIIVTKGSIKIDFDGISFIKDSSISIAFKLKTNVQNLEFKSTFVYTLIDDYTDIADFFANSTFLIDLQNYTSYFEANGGVTFPTDYVAPYVVEQGFDATLLGDVITITFPVMKYEIDQSPDPNTFIYDYTYDDNTTAIFKNIAVARSLKSYRSYEICQIYRDAQGRKTTALTSENNTLFIPNENSITQNQIQVTIPSTQKPPTWATTYKFGIKVNKQSYETIPINIFFRQGIFAWIKIDGENKNKIKDGQILIVKSDANGPLTNVVKVKVLALENKENNFISGNSLLIIEPAGLYAKIKVSNFQMQYGENEFVRYTQDNAVYDDRPLCFLGDFTEIDDNGNKIDRVFTQGSTITFNFSSNYHNDPPFVNFVKTYIAQRTYDNFKDFFDEQIQPNGFVSTNYPDRVYNVLLQRGYGVWTFSAPTIIGVVSAISNNQVTLSSVNQNFWSVGRGVFNSSGHFIGFIKSVDFGNNNVVLSSVDNLSVAENLIVEGDFGTLQRIINVDLDPDGFLYLVVEGTESGNGSTRRGFLSATVDLRFVNGLYVFESIPIDSENEIFYETPEVYTITDGEHQFEDHILTKTFNCFCQGNGVESFQIRDAFNEKYLSIDFCPTAVSEDTYKQIRRFKDITYSGVFNSNTNINKLNEFNLSLANFKEDIESSYGPIYKLKGQDTNLEVYQEDKDSIVYYGKDMLFNADGTTNLSRIEEVLGQQKTFEGEYGISTHSDSFDDYGFNSYHTDVKRGVVIKKSNNGLFEISSQGMRAYFKTLFRNNVINHINGKYDQYNDFFVLNIQYNGNQFVTWVYSDKDNGWLGRLSFNPEDMVKVNNHFVSFKNGEVYLHNQEANYNTFYGVQSDSIFSFNFNESPSNRKSHKTIEIEGSIAPEVTLLTDLSNGYINSVDFQKKENVFYAYVRNSNNVIDTALINSCQGIGNCTLSGLTLSFGFDLENVNVGDEIRNVSLQLVGIVQSKTANSLILNTANNIVSGAFVLCSKPQSIEVNDLLGYYMKVTCRFSTNTYKEIFAVNTTISKSFS